jgi:hypothetical protein
METWICIIFGRTHPDANGVTKYAGKWFTTPPTLPENVPERKALPPPSDYRQNWLCALKSVAFSGDLNQCALLLPFVHDPVAVAETMGIFV